MLEEVSRLVVRVSLLFALFCHLFGAEGRSAGVDIAYIYQCAVLFSRVCLLAGSIKPRTPMMSLVLALIRFPC